MKVLVTGCAGFIGFHLTRRLLAQGCEVTGVDNLNDYYDPRLKIDRLKELGINKDLPAHGEVVKAAGVPFEFIWMGVEERDLYEKHLDHRKFDVVCHLAAQAGVRYSIENPRQYISSNIDGFFNIMEYCRHNMPQRFVFASSSSVYGDSAEVPYRESDNTDSPVSLYAATKKADEVLSYSYARLYDINTIGLRFFTVYGPWGRPDMAPFLFTKAILDGEPIKVFNGGNLSRDFTYIDDIIEGVCRVILEEPASPEALGNKFNIYNIGRSKPVNLEDFITTVERLSERKAQRIDLPMQPGDVKTTWADTSLLAKDYGYAPSTSLEKGLEEFVKWFRSYYNV